MKRRSRPHALRGPDRLPAGRAPLVLLMLVLAPACASTGGADERSPGPPEPDRPSPEAIHPSPEAIRPSPERMVASALAATDSGEHARALRVLEDVRRRCGPSPAGARASLLLAALHLDPRFSEGSPQAAAETMADYLRTGGGPPWTGPLARTLYLEALEKGASPPDPAGLAPDEATAASAGDAPPGCRDPDPAPELGSVRVLPSLPGSPMVERLQWLRGRVAELEQELERIRDVLDEP